MKEYADLDHARPLAQRGLRLLRLLQGLGCACGAPATGVSSGVARCRACQRAARLDAEIARQRREVARMRG